MRSAIILFSGFVVLWVLPVSATIINVPDDQPTIHDGIASANNGDTVLVAPGDYIEGQIGNGGKGITILSQTGPQNTILSVYPGNSHIIEINVIDTSATFKLSGFTLTGSILNSAFRVSNGDVIIENCIFRDNMSDYVGGAIKAESTYANTDVSLLIKDSHFINNRANKGGAIYIHGGVEAHIIGNIFYGNFSFEDGGAIAIYWADSCIVANNLIAYDTSFTSYYGGAIYLLAQNSNIINNTIANNYNGGISSYLQTSNNIYNNIIVNNSGDGLYLTGDDPLLANYNDVWNNENNYGGDAFPNTGDITLDPEFIGGNPFDYNLLNISPCIDAGDPDHVQDIDGTVSDIGAYAFLHGAPDYTVLVSPENGAECSPQSYMTWLRVENPYQSDTVFYSLQIDDDSLFSNIVLQVDSLSGYGPLLDETISFIIGSLDPSGILLDNHRYFWRVNSKNCFGDESGYTISLNSFYFNIENDPPYPPISGYSPSNGEEVVSLSPIITWNHATDPDPSDNGDNLSYAIRMSQYPEFGEGAYSDTTDPGINQIQPAEELEDNSHYYYGIMTIDDEGLSSEWSETQDFWTNHYNFPPEPFPLYSPEDLAIQVVLYTNFNWGNTIDYDPLSSFTFTHEYSTNEQFENPVISHPELTETTLTIETDELMSLGQDLYWRVKAVDDDGLIRIGGMPEEETRYLRILPPGDANSSGTVNIADVIYLFSSLRGIGDPPDPLLAGDANGNCLVNIADVIYLFNNLRGEGDPPVRGDCEGRLILIENEKKDVVE